MKKILPKEIIDLYLNKLEFLDNSKILIYKYIDLKGGKDLIENLALKFSNPRGFNDPFDLYEGLIDFSKHETLPPSQMNRKERRKVQTASEKQKINYLKHEWRKLRSYFGISCFSKSHDDILMWAHYANKHSGLCIGFYVDVMTLLDQGFLTFEVEYENEFLPLPYSDPDLKIRINTIMQYLSVKSQYWSYEKETRPRSQNNNKHNYAISYCKISILEL
jgi:hypothetical protein